MNHAQKTILARSMRTPKETRRFEKDKDGNYTHQGIFTSAAWEIRKASIAKRVARKQAATHRRAVERRQAREGTTPMLTRARQKIQAMLTRRAAAKRARSERYQRRHAAV